MLLRMLYTMINKFINLFRCFGLIRIPVRFNNVEQALRKLKKQMQLEGVFKKMKTLRYHESSSEKRLRKAAEARRRKSKKFMY